MPLDTSRGEPPVIEIRDLHKSYGPLEVLKGVEEISVIRFKDTDVVRHPLVGRIVQAYDAQYVARASEPAAAEQQATD